MNYIRQVLLINICIKAYAEIYRSDKKNFLNAYKILIRAALIKIN